MDLLKAFRRVQMRRKRKEDRLKLIRQNRVHLRSLRDTADPFSVTDEVFRGKYRLSKEMVQYLIEELEPLLPIKERVYAISIQTKILCTLHFYAQGSYQKSTGYDDCVGLSQTSVSRAINQVTIALNSHSMLTSWIKFPLKREDKLRIAEKNFDAFQIPNVLGFVDCTHIAIRAPTENEELYVNRKGYHSLNVQIVCDSDLRILNTLARYPGSLHDSFIWKCSTVRQKMQEYWESNEQYWLLGDSGYPQEPWIHTPILDAEKDSPEERYSVMQTKAISSVKRCIGLLKNRFRCLTKRRILEYDQKKAGFIINACCILHNICIQAQVPLPDIPLENMEEVPVSEVNVETLEDRHVYNEGIKVRATLIGQLK